MILLKYPIIVFSILAALLLAKVLLGLEFGMVTEVSTQGVKFAQQAQATIGVLAELDAKVNESLVRLEALEKRVPPPEEEIMREESEAFMAAQMVSNATAKLARLHGENVPRDVLPQGGFIWIGDFKGRRWDPCKLADPENGQPIVIPPDRIMPGTEYKLLENMVVREGLPGREDRMSRGQESLGVIPRGSRIRVNLTPVGFDRGFAVQYWAEVEVVRESVKKS